MPDYVFQRAFDIVISEVKRGLQSTSLLAVVTGRTCIRRAQQRSSAASSCVAD